MREIDIAECRAMGRTPKDALRASLRTSLYALTVIDESDGMPIAMLGVMSVGLVQGKGAPWMLGSDRIFLFARDLLVSGPCVLDWWHKDFQTMENMVARNNRRAINLLAHWGAEFEGEPETHGGVEFMPFQFKRFKEQPQSHTPPLNLERV